MSLFHPLSMLKQEVRIASVVCVCVVCVWSFCLSRSVTVILITKMCLVRLTLQLQCHAFISSTHTMFVCSASPVALNHE